MLNLKSILTKHYVYLILIIFWGLSFAISPFFRSVSTFSAIFISAVPIILIGFSQTIVVIGRGFDLSVGSVAGLATAICSVLMEKSLFSAILVVVAVSLLIGLINGIGVTFFRMEPFIMTLGMMFIINGVSLIVRPSPGGYICDSLKNVLLFSVGDFALAPFLIIVAAGIIGVLLLRKKALGRMIYAVGGDPNAARMSGVAVDRTRILIFTISSLVAGLAGIYLACRISSGNAEAGARYLFDSFIVVFMGGTMVTGGVGGFSGTLAASLIVASLVFILQFFGVSSWYQFIVKGLLLVVVAGIQISIFHRRSKLNE